MNWSGSLCRHSSNTRAATGARPAWCKSSLVPCVRTYLVQHVRSDVPAEFNDHLPTMAYQPQRGGAQGSCLPRSNAWLHPALGPPYDRLSTPETGRPLVPQMKWSRPCGPSRNRHEGERLRQRGGLIPVVRSLRGPSRRPIWCGCYRCTFRSGPKCRRTRPTVQVPKRRARQPGLDIVGA